MTGGQQLGDSLVLDGRALGEDGSADLLAAFNAANTANAKTASIQVSNDPLFGTSVTVATVTLTSLSGGVATATLVSRKGQAVPLSVNAAGVTAPVTGVSKYLDIHVRFIANKASAGEALSLEHFRMTLRPESSNHQFQ